jgi:hypothetical protein
MEKKLILISYLLFIVYIKAQKVEIFVSNSNKDLEKKFIQRKKEQMHKNHTMININLTEAEFNLTESLMNFFSTNISNSSKANITHRIKKEKKDKEKTNKFESVEEIRNRREGNIKEIEEYQLKKEQFDKLTSVFTLSEFTTFEIPGRTMEFIYYQVNRPCTLKVAFYLSDNEKIIYMSLSGPNETGGSKTYKNFNKKNFLYYEHRASYPGRYTFLLDNRDKEVLAISFAVKDDIKNENIGTKKIDKISGYLNDIDSKINQMRLKQNIINTKTEAHNENINRHNKEILVYSFIEVGTMILILFGQLFYIKNKIDKI